MKSVLVTVSLLTAGFLIGQSLRDAGVQAAAQTIPNAVPATSGRYQIHAWGASGLPGQASPQHGCYLVDTITGELWHVDRDGKRVRVAEALPGTR